MFLAIIFLLIGLIMLLNAFGIIVGNFWGFFWAVVFIVIGFRLMMKRGKCPICGWKHWEGSMHSKIHQKMHDHCNCDCEHDHDEDGQDHH